MALNSYLSKSNIRQPLKRPEKKCMMCGKTVIKEDTEEHLYLLNFCSQECKDKYMSYKPENKGYYW